MSKLVPAAFPQSEEGTERQEIPEFIYKVLSARTSEEAKILFLTGLREFSSLISKSELAQNLLFLIQESEPPLSTLALEALEKLALEEDERRFYREKLERILIHRNDSKQIQDTIHHILCLDEEAGLLMCTKFIGDFLFLYPEEMEEWLSILMNLTPEKYVRLRRVIRGALNQLSINGLAIASFSTSEGQSLTLTQRPERN